jgi:hypothetical protein
MGAANKGFVTAVLAAAIWSAASGALADEASTLAFSTDAMTVPRSEGAATLTVLRSGSTTAQEATAAVTGSEGYAGRVTVPAGAASATIRVPLPGRDDVAPGGSVYFDLSDPSAGLVIGEPSRVAVTVYEDVEEPTPNRAPATTIELVRPRSISGRAGDADGNLANVTLSVLKRERGKCRALRANGKLTGRRSCAASYKLSAGGTEKWTFRTRRRLPAGRYTVRARAVDAAGLADPSPARRTFVVH